MGPARLLAQEIDFPYRAAGIEHDLARSRPVRRDPEGVTVAGRGLTALRRRTAPLLHA